MSPHMPTTGSTGNAPDKLDTHNRQQLSALVDGALSADEARFMLRRLEHDDALAGCHERWQLIGDVLRGQAAAPAPLDFAGRVRAAVAAEPAPLAPAASMQERQRRSGWRRWGGGAALAASVAAVAMFMTREQLPSQAPLDPPSTTIIASQAELPPRAPAAPVGAPVPMDAALAVAAMPAAAVAAASRRQDVAAVRRASATRTQQAARSAAERSAEPQRALASQALAAPVLPVAAGSTRPLPFGDVGNLQAKPWPRSSLAPAGGALNASFSTQEPRAAFYPFEPRLQETEPSAPTSRRHRD